MGRKLSLILLIVVVLSSFSLIPISPLRPPPQGRNLMAEYEFEGVEDGLGLSPQGIRFLQLINISSIPHTELGRYLGIWPQVFARYLGAHPELIFLGIHDSGNFFGFLKFGNRSLELSPALSQVESYDNYTIVGGYLGEFRAWLGFIPQLEPVVFGNLPAAVDQPSFLRQVIDTMLLRSSNASQQTELVRLARELGDLREVNWIILNTRSQLENSTRGFGMGVWVQEQGYLLRIVMPRIISPMHIKLEPSNFSQWNPIRNANLSLNFSSQLGINDITGAELRLNLSGSGKNSSITLSHENLSHEFRIADLIPDLAGMLRLNLSWLEGRSLPREFQLKLQIKDWIQIQSNSTPELILEYMERPQPNLSILESRRSRILNLDGDYRYHITPEFLDIELRGNWNAIIDELSYWRIIS